MTDDLAKHFIGAAFEDPLFNTDNNQREAACAWKIVSSLMLFHALTNESWAWRAVGIPLHLADSSLQGDIDLMFAVRPPRELRSLSYLNPLYRCFELKTSKVGNLGKVTSLKEGKFRKTLGQLEKLRGIGASQVFLLEAFIVEAGFSRRNGYLNEMPSPVQESIAKKYDQMVGADFGYVTLPIEQTEGFSETRSGLLWPVETIKTAAIRPAQSPFTRLIAAVERCLRDAGGYRDGCVITYCYQCKSLTMVHQHGPYECKECRAPLI
jgi:hypothetical protein